jgi:hypothetical protein
MSLSTALVGNGKRIAVVVGEPGTDVEGTTAAR